MIMIVHHRGVEHQKHFVMVRSGGARRLTRRPLRGKTAREDHRRAGQAACPTKLCHHLKIIIIVTRDSLI
jgi:hypothetical protein